MPDATGGPQAPEGGTQNVMDPALLALLAIPDPTQRGIAVSAYVNGKVAQTKLDALHAKPAKTKAEAKAPMMERTRLSNSCPG